MARLLVGYVKDIGWRLKTPISRRLACGSAGVARLYLSALKRDIPIEFNTRFMSLIADSDRVEGAVIEVSRVVPAHSC